MWRQRSLAITWHHDKIGELPTSVEMSWSSLNPPTPQEIAKPQAKMFLMLLTSYSMNSLFSELFRKCGGICLEVYETISGGICEVFGGNIEANYPDKHRKK